MPSTRKQKARAKHSRQSDVLSSLGKLNVLLGNYPRNELDSQTRKFKGTQTLVDLNQIWTHFARISGPC